MYSVKWNNVCILFFQVTFDVVEYDLNEHLRLLPTVEILQQRHLNVSVTDYQQSWKTIACDTG